MNKKTVIHPNAAKVISYLRFSRPEQLKGDSVRRQLELSRAWARERGLAIDESLSDKGISAFRGANAATGALAAFLKLVEKGSIPRGSILLVESLDRLSRTELLDALQQFLSIVNAGVKIVTLADGFEYERANCNLQNLMYSLMVMSRAHEESAIKSQRLSQAWKAKRGRLDEKPLTKMVPAWCRFEGGKIVLDRAKAAIVKRIFKMAAKGYGLHQITHRLNAETDGLGRVDYFNRSYVFKILHSRTVLGEFQPHRVTYVGGKRRRVPEGDPIPDYYPRVVSDEEYYAAHGAMKKRKGTGGRSAKFVNLFTGLLVSYEDGSKLQIQDKGQGRRYTPSAAILGRKGAGAFIGFPVKAFERALLLRLGSPDLYLTNGDDSEDVKAEVAATEAQIAEVERKIAAVEASLLDGGAEATAVVGMLRKLEARKAELQAKLKGQREKLATAGGPSGVEQMVSLIQKAATGEFSDDERVQLRGSLRNLVDRIVCLFRRDKLDYLCSSAVHLRNGASFDFAFRAVRRNQMLRNKLGHPMKRPDGQKVEPAYDIRILVNDGFLEGAGVGMANK